MVELRKTIKFLRETVSWSVCLAIAFLATWILISSTNQLSALVTNDGILFFGDTSGTNQGDVRARLFTNPSSFAGEISTSSTNTSYTQWVVADTAPTREEIMTGSLKVDGTLYIQTCTNDCNAGGDYTAQWNNPGTSATQTCNTSGTSSVCTRHFDLAYESLSGRGMVVYGDNTADRAYYALWDGSSWSPDSNPGSPSGTNEIDLPGSAGTPRWIRVIPAGYNLANDRSNRVMVFIEDTNNDLHAFYWDGDSFDSGTTITAITQNCYRGQCFDGNWQGNNTFIINYFDTAANDVKYQKYTVAGGWEGQNQAYAVSSAGQWLISKADPTSSRILVTSSTSGNDTRSAVWRGDDQTDGWTVCSVTNCPDTTTEAVNGMQATTAWERFNGEGMHIYNDAGSTTTNNYFTYTAPDSWGTRTRTGITTSDDALNVRAWGSPNSDDIMIIVHDVDCDIYAQMWNGSALESVNNDVENSMSTYGVACPNYTAPNQTDPIGNAFAYDFAWKMYSSWQRNWRFYSGEDTNSLPSTALAAENTEPSDFSPKGQTFRLRINYAERGTLGSTDSRRKLQYTSNCDPNAQLESECIWTDVDDEGSAGIWRYRDITCTATDCADNTVLTGTVLTGTSGCSQGNGCGTWIMDKNSVTVSNMDHNGTIIQESEWVVESNGAEPGDTYYFRIWGNGQVSPVFREQDADDCGIGGTSACTYPSIAIDEPETGDILRHGNWWSGGVEQSLYWAR